MVNFDALTEFKNNIQVTLLAKRLTKRKQQQQKKNKKEKEKKEEEKEETKKCHKLQESNPATTVFLPAVKSKLSIYRVTERSRERLNTISFQCLEKKHQLFKY